MGHAPDGDAQPATPATASLEPRRVPDLHGRLHRSTALLRRRSARTAPPLRLLARDLHVVRPISRAIGKPEMLPMPTTPPRPALLLMRVVANHADKAERSLASNRTPTYHEGLCCMRTPKNATTMLHE